MSTGILDMVGREICPRVDKLKNNELNVYFRGVEEHI